jgi:hypothetical protein
MLIKSPQETVKEIINSKASPSVKLKNIKKLLKELKKDPTKSRYQYVALKYAIMTLSDALNKSQCMLVVSNATKKAKPVSSVFMLLSELKNPSNTPLTALTNWFTNPTLTHADMELVLEMSLNSQIQ